MFGSDRKRGKMIRISSERIQPGKNQPRKHFSPEELASLTDSIQQNGILQPILVRKKGNNYEIIAGERRYRAAIQAGLHEIPCMVMPMSDQEAAVASLLENLQRQELSFFEEAEAIARLIQEFHLTQEQTAEQLGKKQCTIANKLRLLRLTEKERTVISEGQLTERHARAVLPIEDPAMRLALLQQAVDQNLNVAQLERLAAMRETTIHEAPRRTFIAKDVRLFLNTIDRALQVMQKSGISAEREKKEEEHFVEIRIRIPKADMYREKTA